MAINFAGWRTKKCMTIHLDSVAVKTYYIPTFVN